MTGSLYPSGDIQSGRATAASLVENSVTGSSAFTSPASTAARFKILVPSLTYVFDEYLSAFGVNFFRRGGDTEAVKLDSVGGVRVRVWVVFAFLLTRFSASGERLRFIFGTPAARTRHLERINHTHFLVSIFRRTSKNI